MSRSDAAVLVPALAVIGKDLDHPALVDATVAAAFDHQLQLRLQGGETADPLFDLDQVSLGNRIGGLTVSGAFNLTNGATLYAQSIIPGSGAATRTFNWNDGTIRNFNASTELTIRPSVRCSSALTSLNSRLASSLVLQISS